MFLPSHVVYPFRSRLDLDVYMIYAMKNLNRRSMSKLEVQSLVTLIRCRGQVLLSLLRSHSVPFPRFRLIAPDIVCLGQEIQDNVHDVDGQEGAVSTSVSGLIVCGLKTA